MANPTLQYHTLTPSDEDVLKYLANNLTLCLQHRNTDGTIDLDGVREYMKKARKAKILDNYRDHIKRLDGKDKRYYIRLKDKSRSEGRYTLKANTEDELLEKVFLWHLENVEKVKEPTLVSIFPEFLEYKRRTTWSESTVVRNMSIWKNYYEGTAIITVPIRSIRLKMLQEWAYGLIAEHDMTQKEYGNVSTWMKQMFEYAAMEEIISKNPYPMLKITNRNVFRQPELKADENKVLSPDKELALYKECLERFESSYYPIHLLLPLGIIMLFQLGLRPSEMIALRYEDVNGDEIVIRRYYSDKADRIIENRTKAGHGFRRILLTSLAQNLIALARKRQEEAGIEDPVYIFMMNDQFKSFYDRLRKTFPGLCKKIGIPQNTPYAGRRTFISSLIDAQVNIKTIQKYVGHKDAKTTLNNYCFDRSEREERARQLENARVQLPIPSAV